MKKILSVILVLGLLLTFAGCKKEYDRELYKEGLEDYVKLGEYKGIKVDTASKEFKEIEEYVIEYDIQQNLLYKGTVKKGDVANIDYVGKKDGVAFNGGTAQGYDLKIGSGTFIPGFEEGLIGVKVGQIVTLDLTFPKDYGNEELAGEDVQFTVKVNYTDKKTPQTPKEFYDILGYKTVEEYYANVKERAIKEFVQIEVQEKSKILDYPETELNFLYGKYYEDFEYEVQNYYGVTVEQYLQSVQKSSEELRETLMANQVKPLMDIQMLWYAILDKEKMEITSEETEKKIKEIIAQIGDSSVKRADVIENYGEYYIENLVVSEKIIDFLVKSAKIS